MFQAEAVFSGVTACGRHRSSIAQLIPFGSGKPELEPALGIAQQKSSHRIDAEALVISRMQTWSVHVEAQAKRPIDGLSINLSGRMPGHRHGLPTLPHAWPVPGEYLLEGVKFQPSGLWQLTLVLGANGENTQFSWVVP